MAEQSLSNGHVFKFKRENSNLILTEASDHSHEETLFRKQIKISGSANSIWADGIVQIANYDSTPGLKITSGGAGGDGVIGFYGGGIWIVGQEQGVDEFRIVNSQIISGAGNKAFAIDSSNNVSIPNGDLTVGDDLFVNDCAHIDALHVGTNTDTDPGDGNLQVDARVKVKDRIEFNATDIAVGGNTTLMEATAGSGATGRMTLAHFINDSNNKWWQGFDINDASAPYYTWFHGSGTGGTIDTYKSMKFEQNGVLRVDGSIVQTSDARLKENIRKLETPLKKVCSLKGIKFDWKNEKNNKNIIGFIAQEVEKIIPEVVKTSEALADGREGSPSIDNPKSVGYAELVPYLVEAIKELTAKVGNLEKRLGDK